MEETSGTTVWHLPSEVLVRIFSYLPAEDIGRVASVCSWWSQLVDDRRVWRGKSFLSDGGQGLSEVLPIARALPAIKRVSIRRKDISKAYLNGELADFEVPNLRDEAATSAISALVTENLSVDFCLLEERHSNCLLVQLDELKQLQVCALPSLLSREAAAAKLRALSGTLSREPLPNLQSVDIHTGSYAVEVYEDLSSDILAALSTCPTLDQVAIRTRCLLSWDAVDEFSKLQFLQLQDCIIEDIAFLDLCPNLRGLSLDNCSPLARRQLSRESELRGLLLRRLPVTSGFLSELCRASPKLERILIDECQHIADTLFLSHCPQLCFVEINGNGGTFPNLVGIPSGLSHLRLNSPVVTSDSLAEILKGLPRLEILDVVNCDVDSLRFLRNCTGLNELSLGLEHRSTFRHFHELGRLTNLKKLYLHYGDTDVGLLSVTLREMQQLEVLDVGFLKTVSDLSFLRHCRRLLCLTLGFYFPLNGELSCFHELTNLKKLRKLVLDYFYLGVEVLVDVLPSMPHLEELDIGFVDTECNFSFLRHCKRLTSLQISCIDVHVSHLTQLRQLDRLRRLTVIGLSDQYKQSLAEEVMRMPELEYLGLERDGPNFLDSWEWHKLLFTITSKG